MMSRSSGQKAVEARSGDSNCRVWWCFSVDGTPIREFKNAETIGVPYPKNQPMRIYSSLWNADNWATRGALVKADWTQAPFTASYRNETSMPMLAFGLLDHCLVVQILHLQPLTLPIHDSHKSWTLRAKRG
ncbi:hypothetical protein ACSBR1_025074 [Camellia fascicularis]